MKRKKRQEMTKSKINLFQAGSTTPAALSQAKAKIHTWAQDVDWFGDGSSLKR